MDSTLDLNPFSDDKHEIIEDFLPNMEEDGDTAVYNSYIEAAENSISTKTIFGEAHFTILGESDIKQLQEADINQVSTVLLISKFVACLLLHHYEWSVNKVIEAWIDNEERVRNAVGLLKQPQVNFSSSEIFMCGICFETLCGDKIRLAECGHPFCMICWMRYVDTKIDEGPYKCLTLRCPEPFCDAAMDGDMVHKLASESSMKRYDHFLFRSYVENNKKIKWCPAPACGNAVSFEADGYRKNFDVTCLCYHSFCWRCGEEAHRPVDCETAHQWITKNMSKSENADWLVAHTKPCPQCKKPIERNGGCKRIRCNCGFQFCWFCLGDWLASICCKCHTIQFQETSKEELKSKMSRGYFDRLFQRPSTDFNFIIEAWKQVIECKGVLKWCYTYGYYLPDDIKVKKDFFEYIQHKAEVTFEKLDQCVGMELEGHLNVKRKDDLNDFRLKVVQLTNVTKNYFDKLVKALEDGLADVHVNNNMRVKRKSTEIGETSNQRGTKRIITIDGLTDDDLWQCEACGHYNFAASPVCQDTNCRQYSD
ncbi:Zinc finger, RING-type [Sesbania bispinosa]|nr:Zinc finger, RING-type [Sesbania bispinosa]